MDFHPRNSSISHLSKLPPLPHSPDPSTLPSSFYPRPQEDLMDTDNGGASGSGEESAEDLERILLSLYPSYEEMESDLGDGGDGWAMDGGDGEFLEMRDLVDGQFEEEEEEEELGDGVVIDGDGVLDDSLVDLDLELELMMEVDDSLVDV